MVAIMMRQIKELRDVDQFWKSALKFTGPVAVVGFVLWFVIDSSLKENIINNIGESKLFFLLLIALTSLLFIMFFSVLWHYKSKEKPKNLSENNINIKKSRINGDFVVGNKIDSRDLDK